MSHWYCTKCHTTCKTTLANCPNCGATDSFVPLDLMYRERKKK